MSDFAALWSPSTNLVPARRRMRRLAGRLADRYGTPDLGNVPDPLDEAVFIVLTYQTDVARARQTFRNLKSRFRTWAKMAGADQATVTDILRPTGFQQSRARILGLLLDRVRARFGEYSLSSLKPLTREQAEAELLDLPGLDLKGARCVLLYSLGHQVLPVDSNTFRFMQRYGVLLPDSRYRRRSVHDGLEQLVAPACRYVMHVNLVVHGQLTCVPSRPKCPSCLLRRQCPTGRKQHELV